MTHSIDLRLPTIENFSVSAPKERPDAALAANYPREFVFEGIQPGERSSIFLRGERAGESHSERLVFDAPTEAGTHTVNLVENGQTVESTDITVTPEDQANLKPIADTYDYGIERQDDQQQQESNMALGISSDNNLVGGGSISATGLSGNDNSSSTGISTTLIAVVIGLIVLVVGMGDM